MSFRNSLSCRDVFIHSIRMLYKQNKIDWGFVSGHEKIRESVIYTSISCNLPVEETVPGPDDLG